MSYQALYRKWRPKTFDEVKGQDATVTTLKNQIISGRIGHAYLFCGTRGTGKTSVAKIFARAVNCAEPINGNPCNSCEICESILKEASMNVVEIDAASNNGVDDVRGIREQVQYAPTEGKYKVFIIDEVHMLTTQAFNALLKTLEEPPEYVIFILATTEVHKIPVTVLSRCQRYDFKRITVETITERLKELTAAEGIRMEDKALAYIAKTADGAMRDAISLLDECVSFHPDEDITYDQVLEVLGAAGNATFAKLFDGIVRGDAVSALKVIEEAVNQGKELSQFTTDFLWFMRNLLVIKTAADASGIIDASKENLETMKASAEGVTREALMRYIRIIAELINRMRYSSQKRVLLELEIIRMLTPEMELNTDSILERIGRLEEKIESGNFKIASGPVGISSDIGNKPKEEKAQPQKVKLSRAKYEDLKQLKDNWGKILSQLSGPNKVLMRDTSVEVRSEDEPMMIVFNNAGTFNLDHKDRAIAEIADIVSQQYGKTFTFRSRLKEQGEIVPEYVTEEELESIINMDIEYED